MQTMAVNTEGLLRTIGMARDARTIKIEMIRGKSAEALPDRFLNTKPIPVNRIETAINKMSGAIPFNSGFPAFCGSLEAAFRGPNKITASITDPHVHLADQML